MDKFLIEKRKNPTDPAQEASTVTKRGRQKNPKLQDANLEVFGNESFRPFQEEIIETILDADKDVFVVMPTGGGKSLLYQLPACLSRGVTFVISPLLSLIEEQVSTLLTLPSGGVPAAFLTSSCKDHMVDEVFQDLSRIYRDDEPFLKLLYTTPERMIQSGRMRTMISDLYDRAMIPRFVIDEVINRFSCQYADLDD